MKLNFLGPRLTLICSGIALGLAARWVLGVPQVEDLDRRSIDRPLSAEQTEDFSLPLLPDAGAPSESQDPDVGGLVPPLDWQTLTASTETPQADPGALFEAHGHQWCASGCALSRHPTPYLRRPQYRELISQFAEGPLTADNAALESLLFFGPQTLRWLSEEGTASLSPHREAFLREQLRCQRVQVEMRLRDEAGDIRSWIPATAVPLDRRHVFDMHTTDLQPLVTSGTIKRVGLGHVWIRM